MKNRLFTTVSLGICLVAAVGLCACSAQPKDSPESQAPKQEQASNEAKQSDSKDSAVKVEVKTDECISCHTYDEVIAASAEYVTPEGEQVNPHRMVDENADNPHEATGSEVPYDCAGCHTAHPTPPTNPVELPNDVSSCYIDCHHSRTFAPCSSCHTDK